MNIQNIILGIVKKSPMTGYEIKQVFDHSLTFFSGASFGSIYPTLKKLEKCGFVRKRIEIQDGKPNRKVYSITEDGLNAFQNALCTPVTQTKVKHDFMTRLFFFSDLTSEQQNEIIKTYLKGLKDQLEFLHLLKPQLSDKADDFQKLCYRFGVKMLKQEIQEIKKIKSL